MKIQLALVLCHSCPHNVSTASWSFLSLVTRRVCGCLFITCGRSGVSASCPMFVTACSRADTHPTLSCLISSCCNSHTYRCTAAVDMCQTQPQPGPAQLQQLQINQREFFLLNAPGFSVEGAVVGTAGCQMQSCETGGSLEGQLCV